MSRLLGIIKDLGEQVAAWASDQLDRLWKADTSRQFPLGCEVVCTCERCARERRRWIVVGYDASSRDMRVVTPAVILRAGSIERAWDEASGVSEQMWVYPSHVRLQRRRAAECAGLVGGER